MNAFEQLAHVNFERSGELHDIFHPDVSFAAFDPADVRGMKAGFFGKLFLRPFSFQSYFADSFPKKNASAGRSLGRHRRVLFRRDAAKRHRRLVKAFH